MEKEQIGAISIHGRALPSMRIRVGTRRNGLAKAQGDFAMMLLRDVAINADLELYYIAAKGDHPTDAEPVTDDDGVELSELQAALLDGVIDVAVHDLSDFPVVSTAATEIAATLMRADPREALVASDGKDLPQLRPGARIGVATPLQAAQLSSLRPDATTLLCAQTFEAGIKTLQSGRCDAVVLPLADFVRLQQFDRVAQRFSVTEMVPTVGQGTIALEVRADDAATYSLVGMTGHEETRLAVLAERAFQQTLHGAYPAGHLGAYASIAKEQLRLVAVALTPDGGRLVREGAVGPLDAPIELGESLADRF